jgi:hypothetical protein
MSLRKGSSVAFFLFVILSLSGRVRAASPAEEAARHFEKAIGHADAREFDAAVVEFQRAYELSPHYSVHYNIALALIAAGRSLAAVQAFERYLAEGGAEVSASRRAQVEAMLESERAKLGRLVLGIEPKDARVSVDGKAVKVPDAGLELEPGDHSVLVQAPGHVERALSVTLRARETATVMVALTPHLTRRIELGCALPDVTLKFDGQPIGQTGDGARAVSFVLPRDSRELRLERTGYLDQVVSLTETDGELALACALTALPASRTARLTLRVSEAGSSVLVDGESFRGGPLVFGRHRVIVQRPGFLPFSRTVALDGGRTLVLDVGLTPTATFRAQYEKHAWTRRRIAYGLGVAGLGVAAGALATVLYSNHLYGEWQDEQARLPPVGAPTTPAEDTAQAENDELQNRILRLDRVSIGLAVAGTALVGSAVWLYLDGDDPERYRRGGRVAVGVSGTTLGLRAGF